MAELLHEEGSLEIIELRDESPTFPGIARLLLGDDSGFFSETGDAIARIRGFLELAGEGVLLLSPFAFPE
jgi:hypothetical protein